MRSMHTITERDREREAPPARVTHIASGHQAITPAYLDVPDLVLPPGCDVAVVADLDDGAVFYPVPLDELPARLRALPQHRAWNVEVLRPTPTGPADEDVMGRYAGAWSA